MPSFPTFFSAKQRHVELRVEMLSSRASILNGQQHSALVMRISKFFRREVQLSVASFYSCIACFCFTFDREMAPREKGERKKTAVTRLDNEGKEKL